jgi:hypothetical protein
MTRIVESNLVGLYQAGSPDLKIESLADVLRPRQKADPSTACDRPLDGHTPLGMTIYREIRDGDLLGNSG